MAVVSRDDLEAALAALVREVGDPRLGIHGPGSHAWRLGGDLAVFLGGGRAALLQLAHPMVAYAIDHHSRTRADIAGRFQRTFNHVFAMVFGELDAAVTAARRVHAIHTRVHGTIPVAIGAWPAGTPYHANDADALRWVHATLVDTLIVVRERLGGPLPDRVKTELVVEQNRVAALFGIPAAMLPTSWADHAAYMARMLGSDTLAVAPCAREMATFLVGRGGPGPQPLLGRVFEAVTSTLLPPHLAAGFGLAATPRSSAVVTAALAALGPVYRHLPAALVALPAHTRALRRIAGKPPSALADWTDRRLYAFARRVTAASALDDKPPG